MIACADTKRGALEPIVQALDAVIFEGRALQGVQEIYRKQLRETTQTSA